MVYSIIQKSQLEGANRLDADYYEPDYLELEKKVKQYGSNTLGQITDTLTDYHANGSYKILRQNVDISREPNYALIVRATDLQVNSFDDDVRYVSESAYNFLKKTQVFGNELIINKIGNAGEAYLMPKLNRPVTLGMNLFLLRLKTSFLPEYVYIYLNSKYGKRLIHRRVTGTVPTSIDKDSVRGVPIPEISLRGQEEVRKIVDLSLSKIDHSFNLYKQAENLLLEELGLVDFEIPQDLTYIVNYSGVKNVGRIDADYFQPKYEKLTSKIKNQNAKTLSQLVTMSKGFEPGSDQYQEEGKLFIRVSSLSRNGVEEKDQKYLADELYEKLKNNFKPEVGDVLLTKDATPGIAYVMKETVEGVISSGILKLKLKTDIESEYLALCVNSLIGKMQAERDAGGSIIKHWKPEQIKKLQIPILPKETQGKIADLVRKSHEAKKKSKQLLEEAKRKVEEMIEAGVKN